jgi:hypothetical protein
MDLVLVDVYVTIYHVRVQNPIKHIKHYYFVALEIIVYNVELLRFPILRVKIILQIFDCLQ